MKRKASPIAHVCFALTLTTLLTAHANQSTPIPMDQLGAVAGKQYQGDGLSVIATPDGASLRCAFQRLEGQVTREGLWLRSTTDNNSGERFRIMAMEVRRGNSCALVEDFGFNAIFRSVAVPGHSDATIADAHEQSTPLLLSTPLRPGTGALRKTGSVTVTDNVARFIRPGLTEEYSVSVDGVRQDFIIEQRPEGDGELRVELDVTGAKAEPLVNGARLVLDGSGRKLAYNRLRVTDATGRELPARMEVASDGARRSRRFDAEVTAVAGNSPDAFECSALKRSEDRAPSLAVLVDDAAAIYPVRIDPTFSDADWSALGSGMNAAVLSFAVSGNVLYAGGSFTNAGGISANYIAKWDGSDWSALGTGVNNVVWSLVVLGSNLYAGGLFSTAGGIAASRVAKWDGNAWSALGTGMGGGPSTNVWALAVSGTNLYVGGRFTIAGGVSANAIAKWNGNSWSALGSGMGGTLPTIRALAVSGDNLYAGGMFTSAGGVNVSQIAKWDGNSWSALGSGVQGGTVYALAVSGNELYVGGTFPQVASTPVNLIAKWNGTSWSALGTGIGGDVSPYVHSLAISASNVYAGGRFKTAGGLNANNIAKWDGNSWSALGSGLNGGDIPTEVYALTASESDLYAGGDFTTAGDKSSAYVAKANISGLPFPGRFNSLNISPATGFTCTFLDASVGQPYRIQTSPSLAAGSWTDFTNFTYTAPTVITVPIAGNTNRFFRAITP